MGVKAVERRLNQLTALSEKAVIDHDTSMVDRVSLEMYGIIFTLRQLGYAYTYEDKTFSIYKKEV